MWRSRLPAPSSGVPNDQEESVLLLPQYQESSSVPSRIHTPTLFLLSNRLSLPTALICPCPPAMPGAASTHSVQPPWCQAGIPYSQCLCLYCSLSVPPAVQDQGSPGTARAHLSPDVVSVSCAASTPSTQVGHLLLGVPPAAFPARPPHAWRACSRSACRQRGGTRARPPASSGPYRVCCCRWESWRKAFWQ